jgi:hypothetical protein
VRAPHAEIHEQLSGGGQDHARGFRCHQCLEMQQVDDPAFDELRLSDGRRDAQDRFIGEEQRAFRIACTSPVKRSPAS